MTTTAFSQIAPADVHKTLARHILADGYDLENMDAAVPIGTTCRLCERVDCEQRAFPPIQHGLKVDENVRGRSFYAPVDGAVMKVEEKKRPRKRS